MNADEIEKKLAWICENAGRVAPLLAAQDLAAQVLASNLLAALGLVYLETVGQEWGAKISAHQQALQAAVAGAKQAGMVLMKTMGPMLWGRWHLRALFVSDGKLPMADGRVMPAHGDDSVWLNGFIAQIQCPICKSHFLALLAEFPPAWGDEGFDYFAYTVLVHNKVSAMVVPRTQPELTVEQARAIWGKPDTGTRIPESPSESAGERVGVVR